MTKFLHFNHHDLLRTASQKTKKKFQSRTLAVEAVSGDQIKNLAAKFLVSNNPVPVPLTIGVTMCSFADNYCKATGREESLEKQVDVLLEMSGVTINDTHIFIHLRPYCGVELNLRLNKKTGFSTVTGDLVG